LCRLRPVREQAVLRWLPSQGCLRVGMSGPQPPSSRTQIVTGNIPTRFGLQNLPVIYYRRQTAAASYQVSS
jgi:hypothetical protein